MVMTGKGLRFLFDSLNERFFENRISPAYKIRFVQNLKAKHAGKLQRIDGMHRPSTLEILIDQDFARHEDACTITLIHEMAHADLHGYLGYVSEHQHGMRYQAKLVELFNLGAYDGLL